jgi:hypothetical protein
MTDRIDHVNARFGGRDLTFKLDRDKIPFIEDFLGEPLAVRWRKILAGDARVAEVQQVVELAAPSGLGIRQPANEIDVFRIRPGMLRKPTWVAKVFADNPPARYAVLAQAVIAAALTGIPIEAANFDESAEEGDDD